MCLNSVNSTAPEHPIAGNYQMPVEQREHPAQSYATCNQPHEFESPGHDANCAFAAGLLD